MKRFTALFLVFSILALSIPLTAKGRKGADLIVWKTNGQGVRGELIAVKENSLLLLERESGADVTIDIGDVSKIRIVKKSKILQGAGYGALVGVGTVAVLIALGPGNGGGGDDEELGLYLFIIACFIGIPSVIGGLIGAASGIDKTFKLEDKSNLEIQKILEKLRKKARVRNSQ